MTAETDQSRRDLLRTFVIGGSGLVVGGIVGFTVAKVTESNQKENGGEQEEKFVELDLEYALSLAELVNQERQKNNLPLVSEHPRLILGAVKNAIFLANVDFPNAPVGVSSPSRETRIRETGYQLPADGNTGETVAVVEGNVSPQEVFGLLLADPLIKEAILHPDFKFFGSAAINLGNKIFYSQYLATEPQEKLS